MLEDLMINHEVGGVQRDANDIKEWSGVRAFNLHDKIKFLFIFPTLSRKELNTLFS